MAAGSRLLFISGLNGYERDGQTMPADFESQAELIWTHLEHVLRSAGMRIDDLLEPGWLVEIEAVAAAA